MVPPPATADEQSVRYRVELIVLRHLDSTAEPVVEPVLEDYSDALDIVPPPPGEADEPELVSGTDADASATQPAEPGPGLFPLEDLPPPPPPAVWIETPGDIMQEAWRRMRLSAGFRPVLYFSWEQPDTAPFPEIRVHDDRVIHVEDTDTGLREGTGEPGLPDVQSGEQPTIESVDETETEGPDPVRHYALDGVARLRRSRFLHLELDLAWREPVRMVSQVAGGRSGQGSGSGEDVLAPVGVEGDPLTTPPDAVRVHRLHQSRTVQTGEVEYFDGPFIGVLAVITRIEPGPETSPPGEPRP